MRMATAVLMAVCAGGCWDATGPSSGTLLPPENMSLDTAALRVGAVLYACGRWTPAAPTADTIIVDLVFGRRTAADPTDQPRDSSLLAVRDGGGDVLFVFAFPAARIRLARERLPALMASTPASHASAVPDLRRYDLPVDVGFTRPLHPADSTLFLGLGGRLRYWWPFIDALAGDLPNRSAVVLRQRADVRWVEAVTVACPTQMPPAPPH
jgi:hypothetical protein